MKKKVACLIGGFVCCFALLCLAATASVSVYDNSLAQTADKQVEAKTIDEEPNFDEWDWQIEDSVLPE